MACDQKGELRLVLELITDVFLNDVRVEIKRNCSNHLGLSSPARF